MVCLSAIDLNFHLGFCGIADNEFELKISECVRAIFFILNFAFRAINKIYMRLDSISCYKFNI